MSEPDEAAEAAEAAQSAVDTEGSPPPWGDDFNPERAWQTITHLRGREKELESDAKAWKRLQEDEEARLEFARQHFDFADDDDDEAEQGSGLYDEEDDTEDQPLTRREWQEWQAQQETNGMWGQFDTHLTTLADEAKVPLSDGDRLRLKIEAAGKDGRPAGPQATEKAFQKLVAEREEFRKSALDDYLKSKRAPNSPPQPGRAGETEFDRKNATAQQRREERQRRLAAIAEGNQQ